MASSAIVKWSIIGCRWYFAMRISMELFGLALSYVGRSVTLACFLRDSRTPAPSLI
jgi:hypothetical protein